MPSIFINEKRVEGRLILFDLDGTLIDDRARYISLSLHRYNAIAKRTDEATANDWARLGGWDPVKQDIRMDGPIARASRREDMAVAAAAICFNGLPWYHARRIAEEAYAEADATQLKVYQPRLFAGAEERLLEMKNSGWILGVATNGERRVSLDLINLIGVLNLFETVTGADEVKDPKPSPELLLHAAMKNGVSPKECIYVGDQPVDAEAAEAAGFLAIITLNDVPYLKTSRITEINTKGISEIRSTP
jgi:phosphoglycolate phosphatase